MDDKKFVSIEQEIRKLISGETDTAQSIDRNDSGEDIISAYHSDVNHGFIQSTPILEVLIDEEQSAIDEFWKENS